MEHKRMGFRIRIKSNYASDLGKLHFTGGGDITLQEQGTNEQRDRERPVAEMRGENESENEQERHGMG